MVSTLTAPANVERIQLNDDIVHYYCCDENLSRCGLDITDEPEVYGTPEEQCCEICVNRARLGAPCPDPDCPRRAP
jgi:hypothetical protein